MRIRYVQPHVIQLGIEFALFIGVLLILTVRVIGGFDRSVWWGPQWSGMRIVAAAVVGIIGALAMLALDRWLVRNRFNAWHREWTEATKFSSSFHDILKHPAYRAIIRMGDRALPFIFNALSKKFEHWFFALEQITGENPAKDAPAGNIEFMQEAWLAWGRAHHHFK